jgi:hypothetical protein
LKHTTQTKSLSLLKNGAIMHAAQVATKGQPAVFMHTRRNKKYIIYKKIV